MVETCYEQANKENRLYSYKINKKFVSESKKIQTTYHRRDFFNDFKRKLHF